jgi:AAA+ ATPase superfamily predicted ATPase
MAQAGKPATGKNFIGREKELAELMTYLKMGQSVVVVAPRRFGKTSLVMEALSRLKEQNYYTALVDIFSNPTLELLSAEITREVLKNHSLDLHFARARNNAAALFKNVKLKAVLDDFQFIIDFADASKDKWELIGESIDFVNNFSKKHNASIICAYDEFGDIGKFDPGGNLIKLFRSKIQRHNHASYIFSGSYESVMQNMFITSKSPFYRMVKIMRIGYLDKETVTTYFNRQAKKAGFQLHEDYFNKVVEFTKGHPYYTQLAFQQLALTSTLESKIPGIPELILQMVDAEKDYIEKTWEDVSGNREYVYTLRTIAESGKNIYTRLKPQNINVARAVKNLEGMGILFKNSEGYYLSDPLLQQWICNNL